MAENGNIEPNKVDRIQNLKVLVMIILLIVTKTFKLSVIHAGLMFDWILTKVSIMLTTDTCLDTFEYSQKSLLNGPLISFIDPNNLYHIQNSCLLVSIILLNASNHY